MKNPRGLLLLALAAPLWAPLWADEASDRASIAQVIVALNKAPQPTGLFENNADASALDDLWNGKATRARILATPGAPEAMTVIISHEPWGEARIGGPVPPVEAVNPRISGGRTQFVGPDVALTDGAFIYSDANGATETIPLLFVLKREANSWRIAAVRRLAPRPADSPASPASSR